MIPVDETASPTTLTQFPFQDSKGAHETPPPDVSIFVTCRHPPASMLLYVDTYMFPFEPLARRQAELFPVYVHCWIFDSVVPDPVVTPVPIDCPSTVKFTVPRAFVIAVKVTDCP